MHSMRIMEAPEPIEVRVDLDRIRPTVDPKPVQRIGQRMTGEVTLRREGNTLTIDGRRVVTFTPMVKEIHTLGLETMAQLIEDKEPLPEGVCWAIAETPTLLPGQFYGKRLVFFGTGLVYGQGINVMTLQVNRRGAIMAHQIPLEKRWDELCVALVLEPKQGPMAA